MFRISPSVGPQYMKTYAIVAPRETHTRPATCDEVNCGAHRGGWRSAIDEATLLGQHQAYYIRTTSGRKFVETREAGVTIFIFEAGQICFAEHRVPLDRPAHFLVKGGDFRGNPIGLPAFHHKRPEDWVDDFANHQISIAEAHERG